MHVRKKEAKQEKHYDLKKIEDWLDNNLLPLLN